MRRRSVGIVAVAIWVLAALFSGPVPSTAQTRITVMHAMPAGPPAEIFEQLAREFDEANPDITVEVIWGGSYGETLQKAQVAWASGLAPNIIHIEQMQSFAFMLRGNFVPLDPFIENDPTISLDDFYPPMLQTVTHAGVTYGIPYNTSTPLVYLNRDVFLKAGVAPAAPATWEEFRDVAQRLTRDTSGDGRPDVWGTDQTRAWDWLFDAWIGQNGARIANADGTRYTFNSPEAVEAMEFYQSLMHEYRVIHYPGLSVSRFNNGEAGMIMRSTANLANRLEEAKAAGADVTVGMLPCHKECFVPIGGGNLFMFNTGTDAQKEAAWKFLSYVASPENLARFSSGSGYMSARRSSVATDIMQGQFAAQPEFMVTYEQLRNAHARPLLPDWPLVNDRIANDLARVMFVENGNVRDILNEIVAYGNAILDEWYARERR